MAKILLIDDDDSMRPMVAQMLERLGHQVWTANDGRTGVAAAKEVAPELVITDLIMPEKDGIETIVALRRLETVPKIIAISGGGRMNPEDLLFMASKLGAARTLTKPFSREDLRTAISEVLGL